MLKEDRNYYWGVILQNLYQMIPAIGQLWHICRRPAAASNKRLVFFNDTLGGTIVTVQINGLPDYKPATATEGPIGPHGFHLHENGTCEIGNPADPLQAANGH